LTFVETGENSAKMFNLSNKAFNKMSFFIELEVALSLVFLVCFRGMTSDLWDTELERSKAAATRAKVEIAAIEGQISKLVNRIVSTDNQRIAAAYEDEIKKLDQKKIGFMDFAAQKPRPVERFDDVYRTASIA